MRKRKGKKLYGDVGTGFHQEWGKKRGPMRNKARDKVKYPKRKDRRKMEEE